MFNRIKNKVKLLLRLVVFYVAFMMVISPQRGSCSIMHTSVFPANYNCRVAFYCKIRPTKMASILEE